jgi:hypothetical protein
MTMTKDEIDEMLNPWPHDRICSIVREYFAKSHDKKKIVDVYGFAINEVPEQAGRYLTPELVFVGSYDMSSASDELVVKLSELSITHEIVDVAKMDNNGHLAVMVRESPDHQTNIDADLIDAMLNAYK